MTDSNHSSGQDSGSRRKRLMRKIKRPDRFLELFRPLFEWLARRTKVLVGIGVGVIAVLVFISWQMHRAEENEKNAQNLLFDAKSHFADYADSNNLFPQPKKEKQKSSQKGEKEESDLSPEKGFNQLKEVIHKYSGTEAAYEAALVLGQQKKNKKSIKWFEKARNLASSPKKRQMVMFNLGLAYENAKQWKKAVQQYKSLLEENVFLDEMKAEVHLALARVYKQQGAFKKASRLYEKVLSNPPKPQYKKQAKSLNRLLMLKKGPLNAKKSEMKKK